MRVSAPGGMREIEARRYPARPQVLKLTKPDNSTALSHSSLPDKDHAEAWRRPSMKPLGHLFRLDRRHQNYSARYCPQSLEEPQRQRAPCPFSPAFDICSATHQSQESLAPVSRYRSRKVSIVVAPLSLSPSIPALTHRKPQYLIISTVLARGCPRSGKELATPMLFKKSFVATADVGAANDGHGNAIIARGNSGIQMQLTFPDAPAK